MAWAWSFLPQRLIADERFLELSMLARGVLYGLYHRADRWGRGPGDRMSLRVLLGVVDGFDATPALEQIGAAGLATLYVVDGRRYWQIDRYDDDCPADMLRKRTGTSAFPPPPSSNDPASGGRGPSNNGQHPPTGASNAPPSGPLPASSASFPANAGNHPPNDGQSPDNIRQTPETVRQSPDARRPRRDETRLDKTRSSQEGDSVAPGAPTRPRARTPARKDQLSGISGELKQARSAAPPSHFQASFLRMNLPLAWPPGTEEAAERWWARLGQERPGPFGSGGYVKADLLRIALDHPGDFLAAVDEHLAGVRGWKRTDPFAWLARQCVFAAERRADARARATTARAPPGDELPAVKKPYEPYRGWHWRWDPPSADTPGLDPAWPSALDLPPDQHESLAWCTSTPDGPVVPPRRLADVPGALEAYRLAHTSTSTEACA